MNTGEKSKLLDYFQEVVISDTEFRSLGNGSVSVRCVCAAELCSGREHRLWVEDGIGCPYPTHAKTLFVAHYASAELISHHSLNWPIPVNILDTCVEFSAVTCGKRGKGERRSLPGALDYFKLPHIDVEEKEEMRALAMTDKPTSDFTPDERESLISYCWSDVDATKTLLPKLEPYLC